MHLPVALFTARTQKTLAQFSNTKELSEASMFFELLKFRAQSVQRIISLFPVQIFLLTA
jgi:hypothetical protein